MAGDSTLVAGLRLAMSFFTIAPVPVRRVDRRVGGVAVALAPAIGALLGAGIGGFGLLWQAAGANQLLAAAGVVGLGTLLTRGLHLDGLADTADGLGAYRGRERALEIMKQSDIGPFGVTAIALALLLQVTAASSLLARGPVAACAGFAAAAAAGRVAIGLACRRGVPAARDSGLGALVAGTVALPTVIVAVLGVATLAIPSVPGRTWQGPLAVLAGVAGGALLTRHAVGRLGGVTGDVLGATVEVTGTITLIVLSGAPAV